MTEQELREKIVKILEEAYEPIEYGDDDIHGAQIYFPSNEDVANALISAGIGDVSKWKDKATAAELVAQAAANAAIERIEEWKHRAEVWKQATKDMIDTDICFGCHARATGICFKQGPNPGTDECMNAIYKQAEKELQDGKKDD